MTYVPDFPPSTESPKDTQVQFQTNFASYATVFNVNHSALNSTNQGDHEAVLLEKQTSDPAVVDDLVALYCKNAVSNVSTQPQLFARILKFLPNQSNPSTRPNDPMQLTYNTVNVAGPNQFQSFLPGGYLLHFGTVTATGTVTLSPIPTKILIAIAIPNNMTTVGTPIPNDVSTNILSNSQFQILSTLATGVFSFCWITISQA